MSGRTLNLLFGRPYKMQEDDFQDLRGLIIYAIGETEIQIHDLERRKPREELKDLRIKSLWQQVVSELHRLSKRDELAACCQEFIDVFDRAGLDAGDLLALSKSYLAEIRAIANRSRFEIGEADA